MIKSPLWIIIFIFILILIGIITIWGYPWKLTKKYCKENIYEQIVKETYRNHEYGRRPN